MTLLVVWTGTRLLSLDPYKSMTALIQACKSMQVFLLYIVDCSCQLVTKLIRMPKELRCHGVVMTASLPLSQLSHVSAVLVG